MVIIVCHPSIHSSTSNRIIIADAQHFSKSFSSASSSSGVSQRHTLIELKKSPNLKPQQKQKVGGHRLDCDIEGEIADPADAGDCDYCLLIMMALSLCFLGFLTSLSAAVALFLHNAPLTVMKKRLLLLPGHIIKAAARDEFAPDRRSCLSSIIVLGTNSLVLSPFSSHAEAATANDASSESTTITLPLEIASGGTFSVRCTVFGANNNEFQIYRLIVDTGSPYLVLPYSGSDGGRKKKRRNLLTNTDDDYRMLSPSKYEPTEEIYGSVKGNIEWRLASYSFRDPRLQISPDISNANGVIGVLDKALTNEATGLGRVPYGLLGLIQNSNPTADRSRFPDPRPTFFEQEVIAVEEMSNDTSVDTAYQHIKSFSINAPQKELTFSAESLIHDQTNAMELVDLRKYGDFVDHYAVEVKSISFDGMAISTKGIRRPIVAVFDSGLTGILLIRPFWDFVQKYYADNNAKDTAPTGTHNFHSASMTVKQMDGKVCSLKSSLEDDPRKFYISPIDLDWFDDERTPPYCIIGVRHVSHKERSQSIWTKGSQHSVTIDNE